MTVFSKLIILSGMDEINIAEIATLEKKSRNDLIPLILKMEFFIYILYKKILFDREILNKSKKLLVFPKKLNL